MPSKPNRRRYPDWENTCNFCLYFQPAPGSSRSGNCTYHRQWIQRAAFTTCSDMSSQPLEQGIHTLSTSAYGAWTYHRRRERIRTRLFLVQGGANKQPRVPKQQTPAKKRMT